MTEKLINVSTVLLFGRVVDDIELKPAARKKGKDDDVGARQGMGRLLDADEGAKGAAKPRLARIYGFSYEGHYYDLTRPALFLVHGAGEGIEPTTEVTGIPVDAHDFATDLRVWTYDTSDLSIRLDVDTGTLEQILLEAELGGGSFAGQGARFSGQGARFSGQGTRFAGQGARFAGQGARFAGQGARFAGQGARMRGGSDD